MTSSRPRWWRPWSDEVRWQGQARKTAAALDDETFLTWLDGAGAEAANVSYGEVWSRSAFVGEWLLKEDVGLAPSDRAMLVYAQGPEFFVAFVACLRAGVLAVPNCPPDPANLGLEKLDLVATTCGAQVGLADSVVDKLRATTSTWHAVRRWHSTEGLGEGGDERPLFFNRLVNSDDATSTLAGETSMETCPSVADSFDFNAEGIQASRDDQQQYVACQSPVRARGDQHQSTGRLDQSTEDSVAFLQFTSGSTGDPKGVTISHGNMWQNLNDVFLPMQRRSLDVRLGEARSTRLNNLHDASERVVAVSWLPHFHDLGLIATLMGPFCAGYHMVNFSALSFLADPLAWLRAVSHYKALWTAAPDFAYQLCTKRAARADVSDVDLGCVSHLICGAGQRCMPSILREFAAYFGARCNLPDEGNCDIFAPVYGLAEHVASTCGETTGIFTSRRRPDLASCGSEFLIDVLVVDADTRRVVSDGSPGEVWLSSGSIAQGYWGEPPELSAETFRARVDPDDGKVYLRTGDEAFIEDGRLFICGRIKDLIVIAGEKYYSDDVEIAAATEAAADAARPGCTAAFAVPSNDDDGECLLCVVLEVRDNAESKCKTLAPTLSTSVAKAVGLRPRRVVFIRQETILKTTSGKLRRRAIRDALLAEELQVVFDSNPTVDMRRRTPLAVIDDGHDAVDDGEKRNGADTTTMQWLSRFARSVVCDAEDLPANTEKGQLPMREARSRVTSLLLTDPTLKWSESLLAENEARGRPYELSDFLGVWEVLDDHYFIQRFHINAGNIIDDSTNLS